MRLFFFFSTAKTKGRRGEQTCQEEIFRRRWGKRNWPRKQPRSGSTVTFAMDEQGLTKCSPSFQGGEKRNYFLGFLNALSLPELLEPWDLFALWLSEGRMQLFRRVCLPVGAPLLRSATICKFTAAAEEFMLSAPELGIACLESTQPSSFLGGQVCKGTLARCFAHFPLTNTALQFAALCPPQWLPGTQRAVQNGSGSSLTIWT